MVKKSKWVINQGWLDPVQRIPSENTDARPEGIVISLIVIHGISLPPGEFGGDCIDQFFCNALDPDAHPYFREIHHLKVSSHLLIKRDGTLTQYVPFDQRAWHAGVSCYQGREQCNDYAIGIELEGTDDTNYTEEQYTSLNEVIPVIRSAYPGIGEKDIVGHCHIAPERKTDPGASFKWTKIGRPELDSVDKSSHGIQL